ncbi:MAG: peptidyl-prolyl cis-trans isomerase [Desulfobacula sp.]|uniref:peptidylprolyl isomerase n=1 Tax=Desulfobacula sp. TaxID=2593537 RepID=UPI0025C19465|nr:peptidylprolyl isomerase [Desulfobacula sp.]MCD4719188.1 peptidyl-prolyl cis-trans isomerase [Desulfobacula sp.]
MMRRLFNDPIFRFLLGGIFIFIIYTKFADQGQNRSYLISLDEGQIERLKNAWKIVKGRIPTEKKLVHLIQSEIKEEILYREARRLGLDKGDRIIKRRLVQKYRFMLDDAIIIPKPDNQILDSYYREHLEKYQVPENISFMHVFFSNSKRVDPQGDAAIILLKQNSKDPLPLKGDSFMGLSHLQDYQKRSVQKIFGTGFYEQLMDLQPGEWSEPLESAYGWHLVYIHEKKDSYQLSLEEAREDVLKDFREQMRVEAKNEMLNKLIAKYRLQTPESAPKIDIAEIKQ